MIEDVQPEAVADIYYSGLILTEAVRYCVE